ASTNVNACNAMPRPDQVAAWSASTDGKQFMTMSSQRWCDADVAAGTEKAQAQAAADRTRAAYVGTDE
ncbi:MAG: hypothetical protein QOI55_1884, partial [Actinomycetota bacterium]|nr:hypothetical protein [Actinomycetota bacterium]